jgi:hypothetical protein
MWNYWKCFPCVAPEVQTWGERVTCNLINHPRQKSKLLFSFTGKKLSPTTGFVPSALHGENTSTAPSELGFPSRSNPQLAPAGSSSPREFHPKALTEPYVRLSPHTALLFKSCLCIHCQCLKIYGSRFFIPDNHFFAFCQLRFSLSYFFLAHFIIVVSM